MSAIVIGSLQRNFQVKGDRHILIKNSLKMKFNFEIKTSRVLSCFDGSLECHFYHRHVIEASQLHLCCHSRRGWLIEQRRNRSCHLYTTLELIRRRRLSGRTKDGVAPSVSVHILSNKKREEINSSEERYRVGGTSSNRFWWGSWWRIELKMEIFHEKEKKVQSVRETWKVERSLGAVITTTQTALVKAYARER